MKAEVKFHLTQHGAVGKSAWCVVMTVNGVVRKAYERPNKYAANQLLEKLRALETR